MTTCERYLLTLAAATALVVPANAQTAERRATFTGGGDGGNGKCTVEVLVDGAADVEIRGDRGFLRTLSGQPAQWRRFECSGPMPTNPGDVRFTGVDGRGRQNLVQDPRSGAAIVVRIEDPDGGAEGYTFDLEWRGGGFDPGQAPQPFGGNNRGASPDNAIRACEEAVRRQANQQYGLREIEFAQLNSEDNPGRNDTIAGAFNARGNYDRNTYRFSCAVDLADGRVRRVDLSQEQGAGTAECQRAAEQRIRRNGYRNVQFGYLAADNRRNGGMAGTATAQRGNNPYSYDFDVSCSFNQDNGSIRWVQARRR